MNRYILFLTFLFVNLFTAVFPNTYTIETVPNVQLESSTRFVTNPDNIISVNAENIINNRIAFVRDSVSAEIAVVLIESIGYEDIDNFATDLFTKWGIGKKNDNGLLFLLVLDQKQMVFRTGYGLEGTLPDAILSRVIRNNISPYLKQGDFDNGIIAGINEVCNYLLNPETVKEIFYREKIEKENETKRFVYGYLAIGFIIFLLFVYWIFSVLNSEKSNYQKYLSLKKGKGFTIFFTIIFPLFMLFFCIFFFLKRKNLRNKPIICSQCGNKMRKLNALDELAYLTPAQQTEETIKSIDYDVWLCDNCKHKEIFSYSKMSLYSPCPHCHAVAYFLTGDYIVSRATTFSSGTGERVYNCKNCHITDKKRYTIPRIIVTPSGGGRGSGGSFGGGGSWGGGRTGGGGARGGW